MMMFASTPGANIDGAPIVDGVAVLATLTEAAVKLRRQCGIEVSRKSSYAFPPAQALQELIEQS
jgi:hypothetical protein